MLFLNVWEEGGRSCRPNDALRFFPELCSPSAGEQPALFTLSPKANTASSFTTCIFAWVAPFTLLNSVTASSSECKNKALAQFWAVKGVLLRSVCQQPIKANSTAQAVHSATEGFSQNAHRQDIEFSVRRLLLWNDKGILVSVSGKLHMRCSRASFWGQTSRWEERETEMGIQVFLRISLNVQEPLCTYFLLSFWKVGSRSEAISRVLSPCSCELCRLWRPLPFRQEEAFCWEST